MKRRPPPLPPHPELLREPDGGFGWIDMRMLHEGWLKEIGSEACAVLILLAIAADKHGASFYGRTRMVSALGMDLCRIKEALSCLSDFGLVAMRPWRPGHEEGVWQLLPVPKPKELRSDNTQAVSEILEEMVREKRRK